MLAIHSRVYKMSVCTCVHVCLCVHVCMCALMCVEHCSRIIKDIEVHKTLLHVGKKNVHNTCV